MGECTYISSRACLESMYYVYPEFCAASSFRREGRYFAGLQFSTPGVMHDDMDLAEIIYGLMRQFNSCRRFAGAQISLAFVYWALRLDPFCASRQFFTGQLVSYPSIHIGLCGAS